MPEAAARTGPQSGPGPDVSLPAAPLSALVLALRAAGLDPDAEQIGDALWLARRIDEQSTEHPARVPEQGGGPGQGDEGQGGTPPGPPLDSAFGGALLDGRRTEPGGAAPMDLDTEPVSLYFEPPPPTRAQDDGDGKAPGAADGRDGDRADDGRRGRSRPQGLPVGVPAAPAFASSLALQRALRPLQGYRTAGTRLRKVLDETATAELSARAGGLILPVHRGIARRDAALNLVLEVSPSMRVWDRMFDELRQVFGQLGAFKNIHSHFLHEGPDGDPAIGADPDPRRTPLYAPDRLTDPTGRTMTVLVSDCTGPLWHSGRGHRLLHRLARSGPVVVLQPLPQRLWNRTRLPVVFGRLTRSVTGRLQVVGAAGRPAEGALPVPVVPPVPAALAAWTRLVSGGGSRAVTGAIGWVRADQPAGPPPGTSRPLTPLQLVSRFRAAASPAAGRLATHLAAAPLSLPVMQLVQRTMLPGSGPAELAEILLGGLLARKDPQDTSQWYTFKPGVREALLGPLGRDEALLVLKHCSEYVETHFGKGGPNFPALAHAQLDSGSAPRGPGARDEGGAGLWEGRESDSVDGGTTGAPQPFAQVAAEVLRRFMPVTPIPGPTEGEPGMPHPATTAAQDLVTEYERHGMVQSLMDAAQLLRSAVQQQARPDAALSAVCARTLLRLWRVQGGADLLDEARRRAEDAAEAGQDPTHRAVLAEVLGATAEDLHRSGDRTGALELLRRAEDEYAAACAAPSLDADEALRLTLERTGVLETLWRLGRDSTHLQRAVGMLEALANSRAPERERPAALSLAHGRLLLRLSTISGDEAETRVHAAAAARSLQAALDHEPGAPDEPDSGPALEGPEREGVVLDLIDALLRSGPEGHARAADRLDAALASARGRRRSDLLVRAARLHLARHRESGAPGELDRAAARYEEALPGIPRDAAAHAQLLAEWGQALLDRARLGDGTRPERLDRANRAVQVLRSCLTETATTHRRAPHRELLLGRALMVRYGLTEDRVDLREAEHHLGLAARTATEPVYAATCRLEWGQALVLAASRLGRPAHYDEAADAFRTAAHAARAAQDDATTPRELAEAVSRAAQAHHWRGTSYTAAGRPRAALSAYRSAQEEWKRLPAGMEAMGEPTPRQTARRLTELSEGTTG